VDLTDLNNVLSELGTTEGVTERFVYDAYGASQTYTRTWATTTDAYAWQYKFQGGRYDSTTGLYDFRNREYMPAAFVPVHVAVDQLAEDEKWRAIEILSPVIDECGYHQLRWRVGLSVCTNLCPCDRYGY
jgi:hypothetical protein